MATVDQTQADAQAETVEKTVTIIGYAQDTDLSEREFANEFDPEGRDFTATEEKTNSRHYLRHYDNEDNEWKEEYVSEGAYEKLLDALNFDPENLDATLTRDVTHKVKHKRRTTEAVTSVVEQAFETLPEFEGLRAKDYGPKLIDNSTWEDVATFEAHAVDQQGVLVHQSEREAADERYEDPEKRPALSVMVTLTGTDKRVESLSEGVVSTVMETVAGLDGVGKVRVSDCKKSVETEGDCFNAL